MSAHRDVFSVDDVYPSTSHGHLAFPPFERVLDPNVLLPLVFSFSFFRLSALFVRTFMWNNYVGFKQYRLRNLSICFLHSSITGIWALTFALYNPDAMRFGTLHWHEPWAEHLPILSIAYFMHDTIDMAQHEISRWTVELFFHHTASIIAFSFAVLPQKFLLYAYWALLMEVNSIFLHTRSMMQITGANETSSRAYGIVKFLNIITFIIFRFFVQAWQINWAWELKDQMHYGYQIIALGGGVFFLLINCFLFYRIISSDGLLGDRLKNSAATSRDQQTFVKSIAPENKRQHEE